MAVMQSLSLSLTLKKIGVNPALLSLLSEKGVELERIVSAIIFKKGPGQYGTTQFHFQVPSAVITAAAKGTLPAVYVDVLRVELNDFIQDSVLVDVPSTYAVTSKVTALALAELSTPVPEPKNPVAELANIGKKDKVETVTVTPTKDVVTVPNSAWKAHYTFMAESEPVGLDTIKTAPTVPLKSATKIYTPVRGTGEGSRYFLVARYANFGVAVRLKGDSMSVRIEGDLTKVPTSTMSELGFTHGVVKGYWSNHVKIKNTDEGQRFLGAVLAGLGTPLTPMPDLKVISGWGK